MTPFDANKLGTGQRGDFFSMRNKRGGLSGQQNEMVSQGSMLLTGNGERPLIFNKPFPINKSKSSNPWR